MKKLLLLIFTTLSFFSCMAETLRVVTEDLSPYQIVVDGQLVGGRSYLVVKEMLKRADLQPRIEVLPWARAYSIAASEPNVLIFTMVRTAQRDPHFHWLAKLARGNYGFYSLTSRTDLPVDSLPALLKHTVASVRNSFEASSLVNMGFVEGKNLILTVNYNEAWQMVLLGRADFTYDSDTTKTSAPELFSKGYSSEQTSDSYLAANINTDAKILRRLEASLQSMRQDGTMARLLQTP